MQSSSMVAEPGNRMSANGEIPVTQIMIVDDSPTDTHQLKKILEQNGFSTLTAADATEGIEVAKRERPDLILMDVVMPGLNGFQATRELSSDPETSSIPVIIVTHKGQQVDRVWGMRQGARNYVTKPVTEGALLDLISETLAA